MRCCHFWYERSLNPVVLSWHIQIICAKEIWGLNAFDTRTRPTTVIFFPNSTKLRHNTQNVQPNKMCLLLFSLRALVFVNSWLNMPAKKSFLLHPTIYSREFASFGWYLAWPLGFGTHDITPKALCLKGETRYSVDPLSWLDLNFCNFLWFLKTKILKEFKCLFVLESCKILTRWKCTISHAIYIQAPGRHAELKISTLDGQVTGVFLMVKRPCSLMCVDWRQWL